jgi:Signal transduction histidine kinase
LKLMRNPEVVRFAAGLAVLLAVFVLVALGLADLGMKAFQRTLVESQAAVVGAVIDRYPDAEADIARQIRQADDAAMRKGQALLDRYGIGAEQLAYETDALGRLYRMNAALYASLAAAVFAVLAAAFFRFIARRYRIVRGIEAYARAIAEGGSSLDIRDNDEGEFSRMKNEIYKITTMLREQAERLERDQRSLAASIADISHQLKTPLTSLSVMTDLLEGNPAADKRAEFVQRIRSQLRRMEWLVTSLLKLSKLDTGTAGMKRVPYRVRTVIDRALDTLAIPLELRSQQVTVEGDDRVELTGDPDWTCEALINILKNCVEHTPEHGRIHIAFEDNPLFTRITITDNGAGIDREDLPHIFRRFYKGKNASDDSVGIGLAMSHAIISKQGGDISAESEKGKGTRFIITFYKRVI